MGICKRCGKRRLWIDQYGYCEKCHDERYIEGMKQLAGDTSEEKGLQMAGPGKATCRLCGITMPIRLMEKRTGYCKLCIQQLQVDRLNKRLDDALETANEILNKPKNEYITFRLAGTTFHADTFEALALENSDYELSVEDAIEAGLEDDRIYKYYWNETDPELVPEHDNPEDPNAIAVYTSGLMVGHIKRGSTSRVRNLINAGTIEKIEIKMFGGPYKVVSEVFEEDDEVEYETEQDESPYWGEIHVTVKKEAQDEPNEA